MNTITPAHMELIFTRVIDALKKVEVEIAVLKEGHARMMKMLEGNGDSLPLRIRLVEEENERLLAGVNRLEILFKERIQQELLNERARQEQDAQHRTRMKQAVVTGQWQLRAVVITGLFGVVVAILSLVGYWLKG